MKSFRYLTLYPLPKLDIVAVPELSGEAMESYGMITVVKMSYFMMVCFLQLPRSRL